MPKKWLELARAEFRLTPEPQTDKTDTTPVSSVLSVTGNASRPLRVIQGSVSFDSASFADNSENQIAESRRDDFDERAAMIAANGHENSWVESAAALFTMPRPTAFTSERWQQIVDDGGRFLDRWGRQAAALGWKATDVFGVCPESDAPECRYNGRGLVPSLTGRMVCDISKDVARIDCGSGVTHTFPRQTMAADTVAVWAIGRE